MLQMKAMKLTKEKWVVEIRANKCQKNRDEGPVLISAIFAEMQATQNEGPLEEGGDPTVAET